MNEVPSLSHGIISPVSSLQRMPTSPQRPGKLPWELLATAAVQTSYCQWNTAVEKVRHSESSRSSLGRSVVLPRRGL